MKKVSILMSALALCFIISGCCCGKSNAECAKKDKCDLTGMWNIYILKGENLEGLPVTPPPRMELLAGGKMKFHYARDGKAMTADGMWKKEGAQVIISSIDGKRTQRFTINEEGDLEMVVGKGDALPEKTTLILKK